VESAYASVARETARKIGLVQARKADARAAIAEARDAMGRLADMQDVLGFGRWLASMEAEAACLDEELVRLTRSCVDSVLRTKVARGLLDALEVDAARRLQAELSTELFTVLAQASLPQAGTE
jgi:hypothetical protein